MVFMTVGIAAACEEEQGGQVIVAADRMVTYGRRSKIEYENTNSKVVELIESDQLSAVAVGAGASTYLDEILRLAKVYFEREDLDTPVTARGAMKLVLLAYQNSIRETMENNVLQRFGYRMADLRDDSADIPAGIQRSIFEEFSEIQREMNERVQLIVAGIGVNGSGVFEVSGMDFTNYSDIGYHVIGSGADSARLTFIRRQYDQFQDYKEGVFTVLEAKDQAEERQGVGRLTDMYSVSQSSVSKFDDEEQKTLERKLQAIEAKERKARESVMDEWEQNR